MKPGDVKTVRRGPYAGRRVVLRVRRMCQYVEPVPYWLAEPVKPEPGEVLKLLIWESEF